MNLGDQPNGSYFFDKLSAFGLFLGLGRATISPQTGLLRIEVELLPNKGLHVNEKGTVHGGYLQAVSDEVMRLLVARILRHHRAVTNKTDFIFLRYAKAGQPLIFGAEYLISKNDITVIKLTISQGNKQIAKATSYWQNRTIKPR